MVSSFRSCPSIFYPLHNIKISYPIVSYSILCYPILPCSILNYPCTFYPSKNFFITWYKKSPPLAHKRFRTDLFCWPLNLQKQHTHTYICIKQMNIYMHIYILIYMKTCMPTNMLFEWMKVKWMNYHQDIDLERCAIPHLHL